MPRTARIKKISGIYHVMSRSISDIPLFRDKNDKEKYLMLIQKYQKIYLFKVYVYCLMTTHVHIAIDCCGADISKIMKSINQCYAMYFNNKYDRHGHVFQDRFKSKLVENENYLLNLSAYIHNNPNKIKKYTNKTEKYIYSSLGIYLGISKDKYNILYTDYILSYFGNNTTKSQDLYLQFVKNLSNTSEKTYLEEFKNTSDELNNELNNRRIVLIRNFNPKELIEFISSYTNTPFNIHIKFNHKTTELKSLCVLIMRSLCNYSLNDIRSVIGNITASNLCRLCNLGYELITKNIKYTNIIEDLISKFSAA